MSQLRLIGFLLVLGVAIAGWIATCGAWQVQRVAAGVVPLDDRSFPRLTVITVGTGGAYENPDRGGPAIGIALGHEIWLVDAGRAVAEGLRAAEIPVSQPGRVLLTSLLPENVVGLDDLLLTGWLDGRSEPLEVIGPPGTRELTDAVIASHRRGIEAQVASLGLSPAGASFAVEETAGDWTEVRDSLSVRASSLPGGPVEALAYRFEAKGRSVVVGGTGWADDALVELARSASLLVHEAIFIPGPEMAEQLGISDQNERFDRERALHTEIHAVGGLARRAGVETLALVRLRPPPAYDIQITGVVGESFDGRILVPDDGDEIRP